LVLFTSSTYSQKCASNLSQSKTQVSVQLLQTLTMWHCQHSPATAAAISQYLLPAGPTAVTLQQGHAAAGWDRQMDGCNSCIHPAPHIMWAVPTNDRFYSINHHDTSNCFSQWSITQNVNFRTTVFCYSFLHNLHNIAQWWCVWSGSQQKTIFMFTKISNITHGLDICLYWPSSITKGRKEVLLNIILYYTEFSRVKMYHKKAIYLKCNCT